MKKLVIRARVSEDSWNLWFYMAQRLGVSDDELMVKVIEVASAYYEKEFQDDRILQEHIRVTQRANRISMVKQIAIEYIRSPSDQEKITLGELCEEVGLSMEDVVSEAQELSEISAITDQFSKLKPAEKALLDTMEHPGLLYSRKEVIDLVKRKVKCAEITVDRAKKALNIKSKRIPNKKEVAWYIPRADGSEPEWIEEYEEEDENATLH